MIMMGDKKKAMMSILGPAKEETQEQEPNALHEISQELINCVHAHDIAGVADCLSAAFALCDSEPHVEGPHEE